MESKEAIALNSPSLMMIKLFVNVDEHDGESVGERSQPSSNAKRSNSKRYAALLLLVALGLSGGILFGVVLGWYLALDVDADDEPTYRLHLMEAIQSASPGTTFDDSSASQALTWLESEYLFANTTEQYHLLQRFALATFWYSTYPTKPTTAPSFVGGGVGRLDSWMQATNECEWEGILCSESGGDVRHLNLANIGLVGTIPPELTILTALTHLDLQNNELHGSLPSEMGQRWTNLVHLDLVFNRFTSTLPTEGIGGMQRLTSLRLFWNSFTGTIPNELGFLPNLTYAALNNNKFKGSLPEQAGWGQSLTTLALDDNYLEGTIAASVANGWTFL